MEKYKPVRELPDDIKQLPHEETVCHFCGVSYLVHHEIASLEEKIQQLEKQIKRLKYIEDEKAGWEIEKAKLVREKESVMLENGNLESNLRNIKDEMNSCRDQLQKIQLHQEAKRKTIRMHQEHVLELLGNARGEVHGLHHYKTEISQLLVNTATSLAQFQQQCSTACYIQMKRTTESVQKLSAENKRLGKELSQHKEEWHLAENNLKQLLTEEQKSTLKYKQEVQDLIRKINHLETVLVAKDEEAENMQRNLESCKSDAAKTTIELSAQVNKTDKRTKELTAQIVQVESRRVSLQSSLEKTQQELTVTQGKKKELELTLVSYQEQLSSSQKQLEALQLEHSLKLEAVRREHQYQLESALKEIQKQHEQALKDSVRTQVLAQQEMQAKFTELKSTMAASELEKTRLVSTLQEQLQKEKDIADRELTDHLNTVKALELSLLQERRTKTELEEKASAGTSELMKNLESSQKARLNLENKLSEAYHEISTLQAIVERECEERERLTHKLSLANSSSKSRTAY